MDLSRHAKADIPTIVVAQREHIWAIADMRLPLAYLRLLQHAAPEQRRLMLADFAHLCDPYVASVPLMFEGAVQGLVARGAAFDNVSHLLALVGMTTRQDQLGHHHPTALDQFRHFCAAVGRQPGLPRLMDAELAVRRVRDQLLRLANSERFGVSIGALVVAEYIWAAVIEKIGQILQETALLRPVDCAFFGPNRMWTNAGPALLNAVAPILDDERVQRSIEFGANQACTIETTLFDILDARARLIQ